MVTPKPSSKSRPAQPAPHWIQPHVGWIAAGVVGAGAIVASAASLFEDSSPAVAFVSDDAGLAIDAMPADATIVFDAAVAADARTTIKLVVISEPPDATVLLDEKRLGKTPLETELEPMPGQHTLRVRKTGFSGAKIKIQLDADLTKQFTLQKGQ